MFIYGNWCDDYTNEGLLFDTEFSCNSQPESLDVPLRMCYYKQSVRMYKCILFIDGKMCVYFTIYVD